MQNQSASFPVEQVRAQFPALNRIHKARRIAYFDGPGGSQTLRSVMQAMTAYMENGTANLHGCSSTSHETESVVHTARQVVAGLFNACPDEVAFGANATSLLLATSRALARTWRPGDEIIVTEMDHHANIDPWRTAAEERGVEVKFVPVSPQTCTLDLGALQNMLSMRTKLVAVGAASNVVGTINDVGRIAELAHKAGAVVAVDAVHAAPHYYMDVVELGIDILFASAYKFFGPHVGVAVIHKDLFEALDIYKVGPAPANAPHKLETGTQNFEALAALPAAVSFFVRMGQGETFTQYLTSGYARIEEHENALAEALRYGLAGIPGITLYTAGPDVPKTPTVAFRCEGMDQGEFCKQMCEEYGIFIAEGDFYATTLAKKLVAAPDKRFIRAGMAPYNTSHEVKRLIEAAGRILGQ